MKAKKSARFWVAIALIICLISSVGASIAQTDAGFIDYHDVTFVTEQMVTSSGARGNVTTNMRLVFLETGNGLKAEAMKSYE